MTLSPRKLVRQFSIKVPEKNIYGIENFDNVNQLRNAVNIEIQVFNFIHRQTLRKAT